MRLLDILRNSARESREVSELSRLQTRLLSFGSRAQEIRRELIARILKSAELPERAGFLRERAEVLIEAILATEGLFALEEVSRTRPSSTAGVWEETARLRRQLAALEEESVKRRIEAQ